MRAVEVVWPSYLVHVSVLIMLVMDILDLLL